MRRLTTLRLELNALKAAMSKARHNSCTLTNYIEMLLRRDLQVDAPKQTLK